MSRAFAIALLLVAGCSSDAQQPPMFSVGKPPLKQPPANAVGGFAIQIPEQTLMPGEETQPCFIFPLELMGPSHVVGGGTLNTAPGMHHGNITTRPSTGTGARPCDPSDQSSDNEAFDILKGGAVLFASSTQYSGTEWQSFPTGMGYRIKDGYEIVARLHYLNATAQPVTLAPSYQWYTIDESTLKNELGPFAWDYGSFTLPPHTTTTVTAQCSFPFSDHPMHIVNVLPHMHRLGVRFTAGVTGGPLDGQSFLDSPGYDPGNGVQQQYDPSIDLTVGDGITFACTWNNTTDATLGEGIGMNEMCILFGYAYPPSASYSALAGTNSCLMTTATK